ncbi:pitrilysin family protein [Niabella insulamsoli]|uniref:M16 family metallopeptidase n=1 Tax=Niabella insulamsoli TaxID=3144874 RepID=UPI0031FD8A08
MKKISIGFLLVMGALPAMAQKVKFSEFDLSNGLHVVLHEDHKAPVVVTSVMYHVGSKDEVPGHTGMAHFFEHLLFEGSKNIDRGQFMKIVSQNGGQNNANTSQDRTYYFEVFPSNQLETGLWLESERLMHPIINEVGVKTQNEVVKEEKRLRIDNSPYGNLISSVFSKLFTKHPYRWPIIGSMEDLDNTKLPDFLAFNKKYYAPNNAVLIVAGDIDPVKTKKLVEAYFGPIPKGSAIPRVEVEEVPITTTIVDTAYDANIQIPAIIAAYRTPGMKAKDALALDMASQILSGGASSRMYKKMVDQKKNALQVAAFNYTLEDYGAYLTFALPNGNQNLDSLLEDMDEEIARLQNALISDEEFTKLQNQAENDFVSSNNAMQGIAESLANGYTFHGNTNYLNTELDRIKSITRQDIQDVAKKYLNKNQRVVIYYLPKKEAK